MRGRIALIACTLLYLAIIARPQQQSFVPSGVDDLVRAGLSNNKELAAARQHIAEAAGLARQARVLTAPVLDLNGATGDPLGTVGENQYGAGLSQIIEIFGKRGKRGHVADLAVDVAKADTEQRAAQLAFEIRTAYAEVLAERRKLKLLGDLVGLNQETLRLTEARVSEGDVAPLEAKLLKVEISRTEVARLSAQGRLGSAENELRRLAGLDPESRIPESDFTFPPAQSLDELKQQALKNRGDLTTARMEEEQQAAGVALAKAESKPDVTVSAAYSRQSSEFEGLSAVNRAGSLAPIRDQVNVLNFGLSIPLRTPRSAAGKIQAAGARAAGARLLRENLERTVPLEVEAAYQRRRSAIDSLQLLQAGVVDPSSANLAVIREAYTLGQLRFLDVINEQRRLVDTQMQFIDAQTDAARTWADLERASGGRLP